MAGRNFGLTNIYLKLGMGLMLLGALVMLLSVLLAVLLDLHMNQYQWLFHLAFVLFPGGVVVYVIGRIAKVVAGMRSTP